MIIPGVCGTMLPVQQGYLGCPYCGAGRLLKVLPETQAENLQVYCRKCKRELIVNIHKGQCYLSRSR